MTKVGNISYLASSSSKIVSFSNTQQWVVQLSPHLRALLQEPAPQTRVPLTSALLPLGGSSHVLSVRSVSCHPLSVELLCDIQLPVLSWCVVVVFVASLEVCLLWLIASVYGNIFF